MPKQVPCTACQEVCLMRLDIPHKLSAARRAPAGAGPFAHSLNKLGLALISSALCQLFIGATVSVF